VLRSLTLSVAIARPPRAVYDFVYDVGTWPRWATAFCLAAHPDGDGWVIDTVDGPMPLRMTPHNDLGVLDHTVTVAPGVEVLNPMRVVANGDGSEVLFTLFQPPGASDERFRDDARLVRGDLITLKSVLEAAG
jgi:hypothetical protein